MHCGNLLVLHCENYRNLIFLNPAINNYEVLKKCQSVVTVNSKSGAEATLCKKPVLVLGDAFYQKSPLVTQLLNFADLPEALLKLTPNDNLSTENVQRYFSSVWRASYAGEIYALEEVQIENFRASLASVLEKGLE